MSNRARRVLAPALAILAALLLLAALVTGYATGAIFDANNFADRAAAALDEEDVDAEIGRRVADELILAEPDLVAVAPVIEEIVGGAVGSAVFRDLFRPAVRDVHRAVFDQDQNTVTLTLADIGATVRGALQALAPKLAKKIPPKAEAALIDGDPPAALLEAAQIADDIRPLPWILLVLGLVAIAAAVWLAADRRRLILGLGVAVTIVAVIAVVALSAVRAVILTSVQDPQSRDAVAAIWHTFFGDLRTTLLLFAACGGVIAAAASTLLRPVDLGAPLRRAWELVATVPERILWRVVRGIVLLIVGAAIIAQHELFLDLFAILVGLYVAYAGVSELMRLTIPEPEQAEEQARRGFATLIVVGAAAAIILAAGAIFISVGGIREEAAAIETEGCNGDPELCDAGLDTVAFAATHNAMSASTNPDWLFAQQDAGLSDQLRDGVRSLLIDAHYGVELEDGTVKTDLSDLNGDERQRYEEELGPEALQAALRIRDRLVGSEGESGEPGVFLCHRFCELGALPIDRALGEVRDFLAANPDEVLVIVIEDYVAPEDIADAVKRTGLIDYVYKGALGEPWPTLGEMVESGQRVVMMAENDAGGGSIPWFHQVYDELVQETPFSFERPRLLTDPKRLAESCEPNRGPDDAPLFLINHWIDTSPAPRPSNAVKVNAREALLKRIRRCERLRGLAASLIAVDFYRQGDLFKVVEELNDQRIEGSARSGG